MMSMVQLTSTKSAEICNVSWGDTSILILKHLAFRTSSARVSDKPAQQELPRIHDDGS
jgi:hypothetical protein